ncbi:MAG: PIN domain-containing protein [Tyzzerella sp.]|nr:PIN domain-containing protein [Tyzzerella sp.]
MNKKLKIYLDTSVVSYLLQEDVPEKMEITNQLWELFKQGQYELYLSYVTLDEIDDCPEPKRSQLFGRLDEVEYTVIKVADNALDIAEQLVAMKVLPMKCYDDCQHIAAAVECGCDCIVSWNFKHIVNIRTIRGVRAITNLKGYKPIEILNPSVLLESEE